MLHSMRSSLVHSPLLESWKHKSSYKYNIIKKFLEITNIAKTLHYQVTNSGIFQIVFPDALEFIVG